MALNPRSPSEINQMSMHFFTRTGALDHGDKLQPLSKRRKLKASPTKLAAVPAKIANREILDSDDEDGVEEIEKDTVPYRTDLESALPPVKTDDEAIEEYEAFKASQDQAKDDITERMKDRKWVRGKSSIYVDAFNLALDTVLGEESHLFDAAEMEVFRIWRDLSYEAQYLYVIPPKCGYKSYIQYSQCMCT